MYIERKTHHHLINVGRMEETARIMCRSGEALFTYYKQLDSLNDANLSREALVERARDAEQQTRILLSAGIDALNQLHDLDLLNALSTDEHLEYFNQTSITAETRNLVELLQRQLPNERWDWLLEASDLLKDVDIKIERDGGHLRSTVIASRKLSRTVLLDPSASGTRISQQAFFSDGVDRVYMPTSAVLWNHEDVPEPVAPYDAMIGGWAFAREWMYRHVRYVDELGPPSRAGGGPFLAVIYVVLVVAGVLATVAAVISLIVCIAEGFEGTGCVLAGVFGTAAKALSYGEAYVENEKRKFEYGTNHQ